MDGFKKFCKKNMGFLFILPWLVGFLVFRLYPLIYSLYMSFTDYNLFRGITKYGLDNYKNIFELPAERTALLVTFKYVALTVPIKLVLALLFACLLNAIPKGSYIFKTTFFLPAIIGTSIAASVLWKALFFENGVISMVCKKYGLNTPHFLTDPFWALVMLSLLNIWQFGIAMIIFIAALKNIPRELYYVADIDGANFIMKFRFVTLPLLTPIIFYNLVTQLVLTFQDFNGAYLITKGGPLGATNFMSLLIYNNAFNAYNIGKACAQSWVLFIILFVLSMLIFGTQRLWVYNYEDDGK